MTPLTKWVWICAIVLFCLLQIKNCAGNKIMEMKQKRELKKLEQKQNEKTSFLQGSDTFEVTLKNGSKAKFVIC